MEWFRPEHGLGCKVARNVFTRSANRNLTNSNNEGMVGTSGNVNNTNASNGNSCLPDCF